MKNKKTTHLPVNKRDFFFNVTSREKKKSNDKNKKKVTQV